jgi:hypothetical protein
MLNHDHWGTCASRSTCDGVDPIDYALGLEGFVFAGAECLLNIDYEERSVHGFEA